jgi:hypothetical protein
MKLKMGLEVHHDDFKPTNSFRVVEWRSLYEIEANVNLVVQLKEKIEDYILK